MIRDGRTRWTQEENILIVRVHFIAQDLHLTTGRTYRDLLTNTWNDINPGKQSYPNFLANRVRWIFQHEKFSSVELDSIKRSIRPYAPAPTDDTINKDTQHPELQAPTIPTIAQRIFQKNIQMYAGVSLHQRPKIPRQKGSRVILESIDKVNLILTSKINPKSTLEEVIDYVYAGAMTVCEENGIRVIRTQLNPGGDSTPPWKMSLENKITKIRTKIGKLHTYLNAILPSKKMTKNIRRIASEFHIRSTNERFKEELTILYDTLKQKVKALGHRVRRYNERVTRYKNNQLYYKNQKQFYRQLEGTTATEGCYPIPKSMHETWMKIWDHTGEHDDEAPWIREAEREYEKYIMEETVITVDDIKAALKTANNWSAPGPDGIHNYWWKYFNSTHRKLAELFQKALIDPTHIPPSCTLGTTHMIPKGTRNEDASNYRPITCLPAIYKILTGILTQRIWKHVSKHNILATQQGVCRRDVKGCKELLIIDSIITKQAKKKLRNLSMAWVDYKKAFDC
ncbi:uncharacterized protein LOC123683059 [Harmonia axyridis]|uniref:uncharacterized protein LOC123683059 n=1 Tax=Harmonia axyridis TaxID=115357 RepID=UPI001E276253|nr:uncharacterized protein LOC123683059 [Harmonia axyridis]